MYRDWLRRRLPWIIPLAVVVGFSLWIAPAQYLPKRPLGAGFYDAFHFEHPLLVDGELTAYVAPDGFRDVRYTVKSGPRTVFRLSSGEVDAAAFVERLGPAGYGTGIWEMTVAEGGRLIEVHEAPGPPPTKAGSIR